MLLGLGFTGFGGFGGSLPRIVTFASIAFCAVAALSAGYIDRHNVVAYSPKQCRNANRANGVHCPNHGERLVAVFFG